MFVCLCVCLPLLLLIGMCSIFLYIGQILLIISYREQAYIFFVPLSKVPQVSGSGFSRSF